MITKMHAAEWLTLGVFIAGYVAAIAALKVQSKNQAERHLELRDGQLRIWALVDSQGKVLAAMRTEIDGFRVLEEERHEKLDISIDEIHGDVRRISSGLHESQIWQAGAAEAWKHGRP